jgi:hypothetical protein
MDVKLVASDLDGTIIDRNNFIANENYKAIDALHSKNIDFVICTGKSYSVSKTICQKFKAQYGIFGNGAQIVDLTTGEELNRKVLKPKQISYCIRLARKNNLHIHFYTDTAIVTENLKYMDLRNYILKDINSTELEFFIVPDIEKYIEREQPDIFSLVITSENSLADLEKDIQKHLTVSTSLINKKGAYKDNIINKEYEYINIAPNNINKDHALNFLSKYLEIPESEMLAIGDNVNDLEMVKNSGIGIAVGDAYDELKEVAQYVTQKSVSDGAFAEAIHKFVV